MFPACFLESKQMRAWELYDWILPDCYKAITSLLVLTSKTAQSKRILQGIFQTAPQIPTISTFTSLGGFYHKFPNISLSFTSDDCGQQKTTLALALWCS